MFLDFLEIVPFNHFDTQAIIILVNGMVAKYVNVVLNFTYYILKISVGNDIYKYKIL